MVGMGARSVERCCRIGVVHVDIYITIYLGGGKGFPCNCHAYRVNRDPLM